MAKAQICEVKTTLNSGPCNDSVTGFQKTCGFLNKFLYNTK
jgi:hypothetical protein